MKYITFKQSFTFKMEVLVFCVATFGYDCSLKTSTSTWRSSIQRTWRWTFPVVTRRKSWKKNNHQFIVNPSEGWTHRTNHCSQMRWQTEPESWTEASMETTLGMGEVSRSDVGGSCQEAKSYKHQRASFLEETIHFYRLNSWIPPCASLKRGKSNCFDTCPLFSS